MTEQKHIIWSSDPDYEDWRGDLEEQYPELSEQERMELMVEQNNDYLDDERCNLNIQLSRPILLIADIGRWDGRHSGYAEIKSGNIRDCLYSEMDDSTWYVDRLGDLRARAAVGRLRRHRLRATAIRRALDAHAFEMARHGPPGARVGRRGRRHRDDRQGAGDQRDSTQTNQNRMLHVTISHTLTQQININSHHCNATAAPVCPRQGIPTEYRRVAPHRRRRRRPRSRHA